MYRQSGLTYLYGPLNPRLLHHLVAQRVGSFFRSSASIVPLLRIFRSALRYSAVRSLVVNPKLYPANSWLQCYCVTSNWNTSVFVGFSL